MLNIINHLPPEFLDTTPEMLRKVLKTPTLIHLPGKRKGPLFVSVMLHGNETTGLLAIQRFLKQLGSNKLPRELSIFIGNVEASEYGKRVLPDQPDYNRIWGCGELPECEMTQKVLDEMREREAFVCLDIHNNTGVNPHYSAVTVRDDRFYHIASMFSRIVVYYTRPPGTLAQAFAGICPAVTVEAGHPGEEYGTQHACEYITAVIHMEHVPETPVPERDMDLYHTVATIKAPVGASFGFLDDDADIQFRDDLDHMNFCLLPAGTPLAYVKKGEAAILQAWNDDGFDVSSRYFECVEDEIRLKQEALPALLTLDAEIIRQDCLCYFMEKLNGK